MLNVVYEWNVEPGQVPALLVSIAERCPGMKAGASWQAWERDGDLVAAGAVVREARVLYRVRLGELCGELASRGTVVFAA